MNPESGIKSQKENVWRLDLHVEEVVTDVVLFRGSEEVSRVRIEPNRELLEKLLPAVDALLAAQEIAPRDIADIRVESDLPDGYSSRRIAETVAGVWNRFSR
ncbi:MAG: hypothetical protein IPK84_04425 [Candidatus Moraniibacteriota bacterium]|nr:MAG: hypothetical protein IPK84_04425 [Candidatus Moranbacteria bacterium]